MNGTILEWILGVSAALLSGVNILQFVTIRSYKRKATAEADKSEIDALGAIIDKMQAEIGRLNQRVEMADRRAIEADNRYNELSDKYYALKTEFEQYKISNSKKNKGK